MRLFTLAVLLSITATASAAVQVTNLNQNDDGTHPAVPGTTIAQAFITGPGNPWQLNFVTFTVEYLGFATTDIIVRLRAFTPGFGPGGIIETLAVYTLGQGTHNLVLLSSGAVLQPSTRYYISVDAVPTQLLVRVTDDNAECSVTGWLIEDYGNNQVFGVWPAWGTTSFKMAIDADPIIPAPIVTSVTGCTDTPPNTINCPNAGGVNLQILGQNFTPQSIVLVGGIPATNVSYQSPTQLFCTLPPGAGRNNALTVVNGTATSLLPSGVSYFAPACPGDANGDGMVNFQDVTAVLSMFTASCP